MSEKKVIIIGAGLGGLTTGAILACNGLRVTVVERNARIGGGLQSYNRFGATFDTGMHVISGMGEGENIRCMCDYLGISDQFETVSLDPDSDVEIYVREEGRRYPVNFRRAHIADSFAAYFPQQRDSIERYVRAMDEMMSKFDLFYMRPNSRTISRHVAESLLPADAFIAKYISDEKLRALLAIVNMFYAGVEGVTPAYLHTAITTVFLQGTCRIAGGYSTYANALATCIRAHGGEVIAGDGVAKILMEGTSVRAVQTDRNARLDCDLLVSSIPPKTMFGLMDDNRALHEGYRKFFYEKEDSSSAFIVNIKLKPNTVRYSNRVGFYLSRYDDVWKIYEGDEIPKFMYMTPPALHQGEYAETLSVVVPMTWDVVAQWADTRVGHRPPAYTAFKEALADKVLTQLANVIPNIREAIERMDTATPLTIRDYTGVGHGAMCGERKDCRSTFQFMPVMTHVPNLFMTGQSVLMHGFCGVTLTAIQTCEAILGEQTIVNKMNRKP